MASGKLREEAISLEVLENVSKMGLQTQVKRVACHWRRDTVYTVTRGKKKKRVQVSFAVSAVRGWGLMGLSLSLSHTHTHTHTRSLHLKKNQKGLIRLY